jgi:hypothetical protein
MCATSAARPSAVPVGSWYAVVGPGLLEQSRPLRFVRLVPRRGCGHWEQPRLVTLPCCIDDERNDRVIAAVRRLKPKDREIVMLYAWEDLPRDTIAEMMGMTGAAVDQRIYRASLVQEGTTVEGPALIRDHPRSDAVQVGKRLRRRRHVVDTAPRHEKRLRAGIGGIGCARTPCAVGEYRQAVRVIEHLETPLLIRGDAHRPVHVHFAPSLDRMLVEASSGDRCGPGHPQGAAPRGDPLRVLSPGPDGDVRAREGSAGRWVAPGTERQRRWVSARSVSAHD